MNQTTFQPAEIYDSNGNIIQQGAFGINTPFASSTGDGVYDYIVNNLYALKDMIAAGYIAVATLPSSGQTNKYYVITEGANAGKCYVWTGSAWQELTTQINGKSAYEIAVDHGFIGTEQQWLDSFTADAIAAADRAEAVQAQMEEKFSILDNVDARFANIEDHAKMTDSNVDATKKRISNVEKLLQGNLYDYQTDDTVAYTKTVPAGAMPYAGLEQLGGKTIVWNQIYNKSIGRNDSTSLSVNTQKTDTEIRIYGTFTSRVNVPIINWSSPVGHVFLAIGTPVTDFIDFRVWQNGNYNTWEQNKPFVITDERTYIGIRPKTNGVDVEFDVTWIPQIFDLTLMFGAGSEPSTYEEFQQMFPAEYYPYNAGTLLSAGVTEVVSKKADTSTIATYPIPTAVQQLEGYGWSAGSVYNYIDYERKVFVKRVASVDLGTLSWSRASSSGAVYFFSSDLGSVLKPVGINQIGNICCRLYVAGTYRNAYDGAFNCIGVGRTSESVPYRVAIYDSSKTEMTTAEFKASLNGVYAYYELAEPIETDISAYLSDDNLIEVESGGTLTMYSDANGDDDAYHIPVPSTAEYMIDLNVATGGTENEP